MNRQTTVTLIVLVATTLIIGGAVIYKNNNTDIDSVAATTSTPTSSSQSSKTTTSNSAPTTSSSGYKNGTYSATAQYEAPDGQQAIGLSLTIKDGVVEDTSIDNQASGRESFEYNERFIADYKSQVVGKKVDSLSGLVSGDSLTLNAFEDALSQIEEQAKV